MKWRMHTAGDGCLVVEFGRRIDPLTSRSVQAFARHLLTRAVIGVTDVVPAFTTVAVHYRCDAVACADLRALLEALLALPEWQRDAEPREVEMPVCYGGVCGPDLDAVAAACGCTTGHVVERHVESAHRVAMLGFAPGFPYLIGLDPRLAVPRRDTPRLHVPAGSVAIAGTQTGIYPFDTPGGWNLIGRTPLSLFEIERAQPCLLAPGDAVRFVPIDFDDYERRVAANRPTARAGA